MDKFQQADHDWKQLLWKIARRETQEFESKSLIYSDNLIECNCRRSLMCWIYSCLVNYKMAPAIEDLDIEVKKKMWDTVNDICAGRVEDKKKKLQIAKVFYVIEYFLNENQKNNVKKNYMG